MKPVTALAVAVVALTLAACQTGSGSGTPKCPAGEKFDKATMTCVVTAGK